MAGILRRLPSAAAVRPPPCRWFSAAAVAHPLINAVWRDPETERGGQFSKALRLQKRIPGAVSLAGRGVCSRSIVSLWRRPAYPV